ncbi:MAG: AmmeMemoRadiSam system protein B [candidate division Zixibacteria bacterium]
MKVRIIFVGIILVIAWGMVTLGAAMDKSNEAIIRYPAVSGMFYPSDGEDLLEMVNQHLAEVKDLPEIDGQIIALIVPHAGIEYSGQIAAYSYKLLENSSFNKIILCGPSHRVPFDGISVYGPDVTWQTPLGDVICDNDLCLQLIENNKSVKFSKEAHNREHSLEVQLPYLQAVLKDFTLVPATMGFPAPETIDALAAALTDLEMDKNTVMVASTDWQHHMSAKAGWKYDSLGLECLEKMNPDELQKLLAEKKTQMCGGAPTVAVMKAAMAKGADKVEILKYGDSGDITGDKSSVVSYAAAVLYKANENNELSEADKKKLLKIARQSIETYLETETIPKFDVPESLKRLGAAFVTLEKDHRLRGCIGQTIAITPLYETVSHCAIQAAVSDPRFPPVKRVEMNQIHLEISVLTPLQKVESLDEIEVGRDGLMISMGRNRGLLLPQVATDYGWDRETFLRQTCKKAGLAPDAYKSAQAEIFKFQAIIFEE